MENIKLKEFSAVLFTFLVLGAIAYFLVQPEAQTEPTQAVESTVTQPTAAAEAATDATVVISQPATVKEATVIE